MYRINREKLKTYILIILILTSLVQVGILWGYQEHGFPTNFLLTIFKSSELSQSEIDRMAREEFFRPYRLVLSSGDLAHWIIGSGDDIYEKVWSGSKEYIKNAILSKPQVSTESWDELVTRKGIFLDFKLNVDVNLMKWFLGMGSSSGSGEGLTGINKVFIIPKDGITTSLDIVYILNEGTVHKYIVNVDNEDLNRETFEKYLVELEEDTKYEAKKYWVIREFDPKGRLSFSYSPDIPCVVEMPLEREYSTLNYSIPGKMEDKDENELAHLILANEQYSFDRTIGMDDTVIFKNQNSIYKIYNDGFMEYTYISSTGHSDREDIGKAFSNAYGFISRLGKSLIPKNNIYLSDVNIKGGGSSFEFTFNYMVDNVPVFIEYNTLFGEKGKISDAIVIEADSRRVLSCRWLVRDIQKNGKKVRYNVGFNSIDKRVLDETIPGVGDISVAYVLRSAGEKELAPSWVIESTTGSRNILPLLRAEGE